MHTGPTHGEFLEQLGSKFELNRDGGEPIEIQLKEVSELKATRSQEVFSLVFHGPSDIFLPQALYRLDHEAMGALSLFLVPIGNDGKGFEYEAVFNRLTDSA